MGSLKSPCRTFCWSAIQTVALNRLVIGDRQTNIRTLPSRKASACTSCGGGLKWCSSFRWENNAIIKRCDIWLQWANIWQNHRYINLLTKWNNRNYQWHYIFRLLCKSWIINWSFCSKLLWETVIIIGCNLRFCDDGILTWLTWLMPLLLLCWSIGHQRVACTARDLELLSQFIIIIFIIITETW